MKAKLQMLACGIGFPLIGWIMRWMNEDIGPYGWIDAFFYYSMLVIGGLFFVSLFILLLADSFPVIIRTITRVFDFLIGFVEGFRVVKNSSGRKR
jgi:hypothetical protein